MHFEITRICLIIASAVAGVLSVVLCYYSDDVDMGKEGATVSSLVLMVLTTIMLTVSILL